MNIDNELLAAYAEGNVSQEEREAVRQYLAANPDKMEPVLFAMDIDDDYLDNLGTMLDDIEADIHKPLSINHSSGELVESKPSTLPMLAMAAQNKVDNLCAVHCEGYALRKLGVEISDEELLAETKAEGWLKEEGTALHNIGHLSGARGLSVSQRYQCNIADIEKSLSYNNVVIAAIDSKELITSIEAACRGDQLYGFTPNHVVVIESIDTKQQTITITDFATPEKHNVYSIPLFLEAWNDSANYLVVISRDGEYTPHPIKLDDVEIEDELLELREAIAENAHEVWAETRRSEGWTYGPVRDDSKKQHPDMLPYNRLPESEKEYDRLMAMNTIKLVKKLGWEFKKSQTAINSKSTNTMEGKKQTTPARTYRCNDCGSEIHKHDVFCPKCGKKLEHYDFED